MLLQTSLPETIHNPNRTIAGTPFIALGLRLFDIYEIQLKIGNLKITTRLTTVLLHFSNTPI